MKRTKEEIAARQRIERTAQELVRQSENFGSYLHDTHPDLWPAWAKTNVKLAASALLNASLVAREAAANGLTLSYKEESGEFWLHVSGREGRKASFNITPSKKSFIARRALMDVMPEVFGIPPKPAVGYVGEDQPIHVEVYALKLAQQKPQRPAKRPGRPSPHRGKPRSS